MCFWQNQELANTVLKLFSLYFTAEDIKTESKWPKPQGRCSVRTKAKTYCHRILLHVNIQVVFLLWNHLPSSFNTIPTLSLKELDIWLFCSSSTAMFKFWLSEIDNLLWQFCFPQTLFWGVVLAVLPDTDCSARCWEEEWHQNGHPSKKY